MEYKNRDYEIDKKIAEMIYQRHFYNFKNHKDDLVQFAIIRLWKFKNQELMTECPFTLACKIARRAMVDYIRPHAKFLNDVSIFEQSENDLSYMEILRDKQSDNNMKIRYEFLKTLIQHEVKGMKLKEAKIIKLYLNRMSQQNIAKIVNCTQQNVAKHIKKFRERISDELDREVA